MHSGLLVYSVSYKWSPLFYPTSTSSYFFLCELNHLDLYWCVFMLFVYKRDCSALLKLKSTYRETRLFILGYSMLLFRPKVHKRDLKNYTQL